MNNSIEVFVSQYRTGVWLRFMCPLCNEHQSTELLRQEVRYYPIYCANDDCDRLIFEFQRNISLDFLVGTQTDDYL